MYRILLDLRLAEQNKLPDMITSEEYAYGVIPLRYDNSKYEVFLIQHRKGYHWGFPKGHPEAEDSNIEDTSKRELKEETGLDIQQFLFDKKVQCFFNTL